MTLDVDLDSMFKSTIHDEVASFIKRDDEFRREILQGGELLGIKPEISNASISLNNNVNFFLSSCRKNGILFPLDSIIAYDLCSYLEHIYFEGLCDSIDGINKSISDYLNRNGLSRLFHSGTYYKDICEALRYHIQIYNNLSSRIYNYDINKNGCRVVSFILTDAKDKHEVIRAHKLYHAKMNNVKVLEELEKIK